MKAVKRSALHRLEDGCAHKNTRNAPKNNHNRDAPHEVKEPSRRNVAGKQAFGLWNLYKTQKVWKLSHENVALRSGEMIKQHWHSSGLLGVHGRFSMMGRAATEMVNDDTMPSVFVFHDCAGPGAVVPHD
jgi:hypothetical protein